MPSSPMYAAPFCPTCADPGVAKVPPQTYIGTMRKYLAAIILVPVLLGLGACASPPFSAEVTGFHTLPPSLAPQQFVLVPADETKTGSLEFASYATLVVNELQARGFRQAGSLGQSDYVVRLDYGIGAGTSESRSVPVYGYYPDQYRIVRGQTPEGKPFSARIYDSGGHVPLGYAQETRTVYRRTLTLDILEAAPWRRGQAKTVYEGRVVSVGPEAEVGRVVPLMIRTLFADFPGPSGVTRTIVLPD